MKFKAAIICATYLVLSALPASAAGDAEKGKKVFNKCKACHMVGDNAKMRVGPPLNDIIGAKAGVQEGYKYSKAMVEAGEGGMVWDMETLSAYLLKPRDVVPKGKMAFPGLKKEEDRINVIEYLKQYSSAQ